MSMSFIVFILGTIVGSFLNVCIYRLPREKSIISLHYFCPSCEGPIGFYDNIPILSYVLLKSRCRNCNTKISIRYPTVEFITALLFLLLYKKTGLNIELLVLMLFVAVLIVISLIDFEFKIIPDILSLGGLVIGFMLSFIRPFFGFLDSLYGILLGGGVLFAITTSGNSKNVLSAAKKAKELNLPVISLTGKGGGKIAELSDILLDVPSDSTPRIQELHIMIYHYICEKVEFLYI